MNRENNSYLNKKCINLLNSFVTLYHYVGVFGGLRSSFLAFESPLHLPIWDLFNR